MYGLRATREANTNGHVDITTEAEHTYPVVRRLVEAKIYRSPSYHVQGLHQLILRYSTGREGRGWLVNYVRQNNIKGIVCSLREHLDSNKPCDQKGESRDHTITWWFASTHRHNSGEDIEVVHASCNLFTDATE
jgi:hypothetical protein